jgi:hypothetical protein
MAKRDNLSIKYPRSVEIEQTDLQSSVINLESRSVEEEKPAIVIPETPKYNKGISNTRLIRSSVDAIYKTTGAVSGREYVFNGGGSVVEVNKEDVDEFLSRRNRKGCCGSPIPTPIFELV